MTGWRMKSNSNFWLALHQLANELDREGANNEDRTRTLREVLRSQSPAAQTVYRQNATFVLRTLNSIVVDFDGKDGTGRPADET